jgi:ABC-2 type transport system ATP-binding protein
MAVIEVEHLSKRYGEKVAVDDVSFAVEEGEIFGVLGPNGAGKTTTVECISGLRRPDGGRVRVLGRAAGDAALRELLGVQPQDSALPDRIRVGEALDLYRAFYRDGADVEALVYALGLESVRRRAFAQLSGGERQRLSIALALIGRPRIAILDELTTGLDPQARRATWALIEDVRAQGVTILLVTHFMEEAERLCDRVAIIHAGAIVALDTPAALLADLGGELLELRVDGDVAIALAALGARGVAARDAYVVGSTLTVPLHDASAGEAIAAISDAGLPTSAISSRRPTLDDIYLRLTGEDLPAAA